MVFDINKMMGALEEITLDKRKTSSISTLSGPLSEDYSMLFSKEHMAALYNGWNGTSHKAFPGFFTPFESVTEVAVNATASPVVVSTLSLLLAGFLSLSSLTAAGTSIKALFKGEFYKAFINLLSASLLVSSSVLVAVAAIPLIAAGFSISLVTRALSTIKETIAEFINPVKLDPELASMPVNEMEPELLGQLGLDAVVTASPCC